MARTSLTKQEAEDLISHHFHSGWKETYIYNFWEKLQICGTFVIRPDLHVYRASPEDFEVWQRRSF